MRKSRFLLYTSHTTTTPSSLFGPYLLFFVNLESYKITYQFPMVTIISHIPRAHEDGWQLLSLLVEWVLGLNPTDVGISCYRLYVYTNRWWPNPPSYCVECSNRMPDWEPDRVFRPLGQTRRDSRGSWASLECWTWGVSTSHSLLISFWYEDLPTWQTSSASVRRWKGSHQWYVVLTAYLWSTNYRRLK